MKKIERKYPIGTFGYTEEKNETCHGFVYVKELDLDQIEREREEQQKIIDELKANNFAMSAMVCKHPEKRSLNENYDSIKDYCDMLKAENPDVPCPACDGTVSTVKALQYENEQLENKIKHLQDSAQKCLDNLSKCDI